MQLTQATNNKQVAFWQGVKAELPIALGVVPFGLIYGVVALAAGLPPVVAQCMSFIVFAGSAQFIGADLWGAGAGLPVMWLTTFIVNLRHMLYSASLAPHTTHLSWGWRWLLAYLLTDEAYAPTIQHYNDKQIAPDYKHWFWLGAGVMLWGQWQLSTAVGIFLGTQIPPEWGLDFTLALTFIGIVVPTLKARPHLLAAFVAGIVALLTFAWPYKLGLMVAALVGIGAGVWATVGDKSR